MNDDLLYRPSDGVIYVYPRFYSRAWLRYVLCRARGHRLAIPDTDAATGTDAAICKRCGYTEIWGG